jgi:hypothetical protein
MDYENLINKTNNYIDVIINDYSNLGINPCITIIKINRYKTYFHILLMYSATKLKECMKKHIKKCNCRNIIYVNIMIDSNLKLIKCDDNSVYVDDLYNIILNVFKNIDNVKN